jgi:hypothetical protein
MIGYQFLIEADLLTPAGVPETVRFCCQPGFSGGGHTWYPVIIDPGLWQAALFSGGKTSGPSTYSYGQVVLDNFLEHTASAGVLDWLKGYQFYGRPVRMYYGPEDAVYPGGFRQAYTAAIQNTPVDWEKITFSLKGRQAELDVPLDGGTFLGNNTPPAGLEGGVELQGKDKPVLIGRAFNFSLTQVNSSKLIYAVSPLTGLSVTELNADLHIYDNGVELYFQGKTTDLEGTTPSPASFLASESGYVSLGSTPVGPLTCSGACLGYALTAKPANLITYLLTLAGKADMIDAASFAAHAAIDGYERGIFINGKTNLSQIIDQLLAPCGYWTFSPAGKMILGLLKDPATMMPVYAFASTTNIQTFIIRKALDTKGGAPASKVTVRYGRNYTVQKQPAAGVTSDRKAWLAEEYLLHSAAASPENVQASSEEKIVDTACTSANSLHTGELQTFYCVERELIDIDVITTEFLPVSEIPIGSCVTLDLQGRFDYSGRKMLLVSQQPQYAAESIRVTLWG